MLFARRRVHEPELSCAAQVDDGHLTGRRWPGSVDEVAVKRHVVHGGPGRQVDGGMLVSTCVIAGWLSRRLQLHAIVDLRLDRTGHAQDDGRALLGLPHVLDARELLDLVAVASAVLGAEDAVSHDHVRGRRPRGRRLSAVAGSTLGDAVSVLLRPQTL
eukprot:scaffold2299_cov205-Pinguiococcus_pyrenoidosus.AAC.1